jgi:hypothetical protein
MADVKIPYPEAGLAAFEALDSYEAGLLISGNWPPLSPGYPLEVKADEELPQFAVVGLDSDGKLVMATYDDDPSAAIKPIGICTQAVKGDSGGGTTVPVIYSGCFNPDMLVWDDSFDTDEKKLNAFVGSPTPTQIVLRKRG